MILPVHWYTFLVPPAFFSGLIESLSQLNFDLNHLIFILETLCLPVMAIYFTARYLTPVFNRKLMDLEQSDRNSKIKTEKLRTTMWFNLMSSIFARGNQEKAAFRFMWKLTGRERLFKQTLLPSVGYIIIMIILPFFTKPVPLAELAKGDRFIFLLYVLLFVAATLPGSLITGSNQNTSWIFKTLPMDSPAIFFKGTIKAAYARFFIPIFMVFGLVTGYIWGVRIIPDIITVLLASYLFTLLFYFFQTPYFPFSTAKAASQGGMAGIRVMIIMGLAAAAGFLHNSILHLFSGSNLILIPLYIFLIYLVNNYLVFRKISWRTVDKMNIY
jgi:ABC-2 type transport system permease protein